MSSYRSSSPFSGRRSSRAYICLYVAVTVVLFFAIFVYTPLPNRLDGHRDAIVEQLKDATLDNIPVEVTLKSNYGLKDSVSLEGTKSKYAYATFLAGDSEATAGDDTINHDKYFVATRILAYQLLHARETRTNSDYPFVVLVTPDVSKAKRDRLRRDGAIVWEAPALDAGWIKTDVSTWQNVMSKLRLWQLTQFERICFLDGDTILTKSLDDIFDDPAVTARGIDDRPEATLADEARLPSEYVFAGVPEGEVSHHYPPTEDHHDWPNINYLNAGFFVLQPSMPLLEYYISLTTLPDRFNPHLPEQNLLNYAHRRTGNMAWRQLDTKWNMHYPTVEDLAGGVASLHEKWWAPVNADLAPFLQAWRWRMEGYWEARDTLAAR
ncbi:hypothetical protein LTR36_002720 [Oleoguttula mirabilis]|uniref:Nucleotide-diphospho-sugar transferase n=1 Tax=Oleoguttula mirabilis TaxID=1507867 RepID=A0AAV9JKJ9_9PEZI|nr:hypothetical protein LTR36_002720 [Oleoguttula mirabilis]